MSHSHKEDIPVNVLQQEDYTEENIRYNNIKIYSVDRNAELEEIQKIAELAEQNSKDTLPIVTHWSMSAEFVDENTIKIHVKHNLENLITNEIMQFLYLIQQIHITGLRTEVLFSESSLDNC